MKKQKIYAIEAVALILGTILVSSISAESIGISSDDFMHSTQIGPGKIVANVKLIYGSSDYPLIWPLSNVKITATNIFDSSFSYMGTTSSNGRCTLTSVHPGFYRVKAERAGHVDISSGSKNYKIVQVRSSQTTSVGFTLTAEGSPWDTEISCV